MNRAADTAGKKPVGPYAQLTQPSGVERAMEDQDAAERLVEQQEAIKAQRAKALKEGRTDKIAKVLNQKRYVTDRTWQFLTVTIGGKSYQLSVSQFFFDIDVAVDKFYDMAEYEAGHTALKQKLLNANGIKYVALNPTKRLADIEVELEAQDKVKKPAVEAKA